ncbi:hypothetical protein C8T65DRAFT_669645 [Cerioporus squamosus]|nr:hypothetical protein C8T65DRAFT_669645 [Cerioporus squamosus]
MRTHLLDGSAASRARPKIAQGCTHRPVAPVPRALGCQRRARCESGKYSLGTRFRGLRRPAEA